MAGPVGWVDELSLTLGERVAVTVGLLGLVGITSIAARWLRRRLRRDNRDRRLLIVGLVIVVLAVAIAVGAGIVSLWAELPAVNAVLAATSLGNPVVLATRGVMTVVVVVGVYLVTGLIERLVYEYTEGRGSITQHQRELVFRTTQVSTYLLAALVIFSVWGVNLGGLLVGAGFLGIVVGLAARQTLGALIAGFVLMFARPFEIGDWVQIGDREGIVTEISIVNTRVQTFDGEYAMIPNDTVGASEVINRTRKGRLRIEVDVGVDYGTDVEEAMSVAVAAIGDVDDVLAVPQPRAVLKGFDASAVTIGLRFWIDKPSARRKWRAQTAVITAVKAAFEEAGVKIPFPQRELMSREEAGGFRVDSPGGDVGDAGNRKEQPGAGDPDAGNGE